MSDDFKKILSFSRQEKTGTWLDDVRVLLFGVLACVFLIIFIQPTISRLYDVFWAERPFVSATVAIYKVEGREYPMVLYDADATQPVDGSWIASIFTASDNARWQTRRGSGSYSTRLDEPRLWTWQGFFDNEVSDYPDIPEEPFYVCVSYILEARDSGAHDETPAFCSQVYDPNNPTVLPSRRELTDEPS